ncbi:MAG: hypothetical protein ACE5GY_01410 [Thermodesulfobacteriota bacterium]
MKVKQKLLRYISASVPKDERQAYARRRWPEGEAIEPHDEVTALFVLSHDGDPDISAAASSSLAGYPAELTLEALGHKLDPVVIKKLVSMNPENEAVAIMASSSPWIDDETLREIAANGPEEAVVLLAEDTARLRRKPFLVDAIFKNPRTPGTLMAELRAIEENIVHGHGQDEEHETAAPRELLDEHNMDEHNIYQMIQNMNMAGRIKLALTGNKASRDLLIRDSNKVIALSVLKNPRITEDEVIKLANTKGTPEDLLRAVARNKEWLKSYHVKTALVHNPKTPLAISVKILDHLYDKDLERIAKSKNIPSVLASSARRKVEMKKKKH